MGGICWVFPKKDARTVFIVSSVSGSNKGFSATMSPSGSSVVVSMPSWIQKRYVLVVLQEFLKKHSLLEVLAYEPRQ